MSHAALTALSPLDGRYAKKVATLRPIFSEFGLMKRRIQIEVEWLLTLSAEQNIPEVPLFSAAARHFLRDLTATFSIADAEHIKTIESSTRHDVKAIEYFLKERIADHAELAPYAEFLHFGCTSEDINNLAYALMLKDGRDEALLPAYSRVLKILSDLAHTHAALPMLARTHGQSASPTTLGKELYNFSARVDRQLHHLKTWQALGKFNGAVGNFNAHAIAYPEVNWIDLSRHFVTTLGLQWNAYTTQIEPHDGIAEISNILRQVNVILIDLCRDIWAYISLGYFRQNQSAGEIGSSTMPHKINPIDFENAEGNFGIANALFTHYSEKLPISRWQRDLSDSTVMRTLGVAFGHTLVALESLVKGMQKLTVDSSRLAKDLNASWEVLTEAVQTVMRRYGLPTPYEQLKTFMYKQNLNENSLREFISTLELPTEVKQRLLDLTPATYTGLAQKLVTMALDRNNLPS